MREAVIVEALRTSMIRKNSFFSRLRPEAIVAEVLKATIKRTSISTELIDDIIMGSPSMLGDHGTDIARLAIQNAGFPTSVPSMIVERHCGSSQQTLHFAAQAIISGDMDIILAAGVEASSSESANEDLTEKDLKENQRLHLGAAAERLADIWGLSREQLDEYAIESHEKANRALKQSRFEREIIPIEVVLPNGKTKIIQKDVGPRTNLTTNKLGHLKGVYKENGKIHDGNSCYISDGAAATLIMSNSRAKELGLKPRFRIVNRTVVGSDPNIVYTGLIIGTNKAISRAGLRIDDIDVFEISEAFAAVPLVWLQETGVDPKKINPNGGAIALGHPRSANGIRLLTTLIHELERMGGKYGLLGVCEGHGMATITIIERIENT